MSSIRVPDTITKLKAGDPYPVVNGDDVIGFTDLKTEVNTNTSKLEKAVDAVKALKQKGETYLTQIVGDTPPVFPQEPHGNYVVTVRTMTKNMEMNLPNPVGGMVDGAIFSVFNDDPVDAIMLKPGNQTDTIGGAQSQNVPAENFATFVYDLATHNFVELETGYIPAARINMANYVEHVLKGKDLLHTTAEIKAMGTTGSTFILSVKDNEGTDTVGVDTLVFESSITEPDNLDSKEIRIKPYINFTNVSVTEEPQVTSVKANTLSVAHPLEVFANPNAELDAELTLARGSVELGHAPAYLAYVHSNTAIVGKEGLSGHHDGTIWFDDAVYPANAFLDVDRVAKTFSIQEADELDPNVTGGTDYLIAYHIHMQGNAPKAGKVRVYLWDENTNTYIKDVNGNIMGSQRNYAADETLGDIYVIGVVNAKGATKFTAHVVDDFTSDELIVSSRTEGGSGILIQALTSEEKTSPALLQFEQDTGQAINFDSKFFGPDLISLAWMLQEDSPKETEPAGSIRGFNDGSLMRLIGPTDITVANKTMMLRSADFNLGKFINMDDTRLLRGKVIKAYTTLANPDGDMVLAMFKWTGKIGASTTEIYNGRNQGGGINPVAGWELVKEDVIVANALGDFKEYSTHFIVPTDAVEVAIVVYPSLGLTTDNIQIKGFNADVLNPFTGYIVKAPELYTAQHLAYSPNYSKFVADEGYYLSLRYTLNSIPSTGVPMPVGSIKSGKANITIDPTVNIVVGSEAKSGEGAIQFNNEGRAVVKSELYIYPGEKLPKGNKATVRFWYSTVSDDGQTFTKIDDSETSFIVTGGDLPSKFRMNPFGLNVKTGDRIALFSLTDATDDAYIKATAGYPMLTTEIEFDEVTALGADDPWGQLDLSQFSHVYTHQLSGKLVVKDASGVTIPFVIEPNMFFEVKRGVKIVGNTARPLKNLDYSYNYDNHELRVSFGERVDEARILIGVYL